MWNRLRKHCSDERLLAHADGELPVWRAPFVKWHLNLCWDCRNRLHELEAQTQRLAKAFRSDTLLGPERTYRARERFLAWRHAFEQHSGPGASVAPRSFARVALLASVCLIAGISMLGWLGAERKEIAAADLLAQTTAAELLRADGALARIIEADGIVLAVCAGLQVLGHEFSAASDCGPSSPPPST
jgi:anti-sigma factor RsiW